MPAAKRRFEPCVIDRLLAEPYRFEFVQAVRMVELWLRKNGVPHQQALPRFLRFRNSMSLSFPASQIAALSVDADAIVDSAPALLAALQAGNLKSIAITPAFIGLLGVNGVLPLHYTESLAVRIHETNDRGPLAFFDCMSNRSVALFYQTWAAYRVQHRLDADGRDGFLPLQLALAGAKPHSSRPHAPVHEPARARARVQDEVIACYAAVLRHRPATACVIEGVLSEYFGVPVVVEQGIGCWDELPLEQQSRMGADNAVLGRGAIVGERCWRRDLRVRLRLGPLSKAQFDQFVPGTEGAAALAAMVALFAVAALQYEVMLVLRAEDAQPACLYSDEKIACARMGWDAFLLTAPATAHRSDLIYDLQN